MIKLLECHNDQYSKIARICNISKKKYCNKNNYEFIEYRFNKIEPYGPTWGRLFGIENNLKRCIWLLYLDTDTIINNFSIKIEDHIDDRYNIIIGRMPDYNTGFLNHISTSAILIKNCSWSFDFLNIWKQQKQFIKNPYFAKNEHLHFSTLGFGGLYFEQSAFHFIYDNYENIREKIKLIEDPWFNDRESTFNSNSFLIHFARSPKEKRILDFFKKRTKFCL